MTLLDPATTAPAPSPVLDGELAPGATPGPPRTAVCAVDRLEVGRGVAALLAGRAVAVFRLDPALVAAGDHGIRAVDDVDPHSGASVISRGLVGTTVRDGALVHYVASPLRKQRFDLGTGAPLDGGPGLAAWDVTVTGGVVTVTPAPGSSAGNGRETPS